MSDGYAKVIALCGIDGTGKTTIFRELEGKIRHPRIAFVARGPAERERRVEREAERTFGDHRDWLDAPFATQIAEACARDFLEHYRRAIEPKLSTHDLIVTDRYATCFIAYARCLGRPCQEAVEVLEEVPPPEIVLHLVAQEEVLRARIDERIQRGQAEPDEFEHQEAQRRLLAGYREVFASYPTQVVEVDNSGGLEDGLAAILGELSKWAPELIGEADG